MADGELAGIGVLVTRPEHQAAELADERVPEQVQVADGVQNLVADELVFVTQAVLVQNAVVIENDPAAMSTAERLHSAG